MNVGTRGDVFVLTEEQRAELKAINRKWLLESPIPERGVVQHNVVVQPTPASGAPAEAGERGLDQPAESAAQGESERG